MSTPRLCFVLRTLSIVVGVTCTLWSFSPLSTVFADVTVTITLHDQGISPSTFTAKKGELVQIDAVNSGTQVHNLVIPAFYIFTQNLQPGENVHASFRPDKTGRFPYYSDTGGKPEPSIKGTMTVTP